ncbi:hypothetical protein FJT64_027271 [Amphibalanus amphitrite]|uniref:Uncharacterized protein n=1 Tax=Amphibalanus amphitrite TaxID=1232801 RepID=A0A6A4WB42_AMPAM|nr:hypothetical protein FJT64_027271 [Amphibalanus amphitrite]
MKNYRQNREAPFVAKGLAGIHGIQQNQHINWLSVGFFVYSALFSLSYLYYPNPLFHQVRSLSTVVFKQLVLSSSVVFNQLVINSRAQS